MHITYVSTVNLLVNKIVIIRVQTLLIYLRSSVLRKTYHSIGSHIEHHQFGWANYLESFNTVHNTTV